MIVRHLLRASIQHMQDLERAADERLLAAEASYDIAQELSHRSPEGRDELQRACTGKTGGFLILLDNDWANTQIDHVSTAQLEPGLLVGPKPGNANSPYREQGPSNGPAGCFCVCSGRHLVTVTPGGRGPAAVLPVLVFPSELVVRRLDRQTRTWQRAEPEEEKRCAEHILKRELLLINYFEAIAAPRWQAGVTGGIATLDLTVKDIAVAMQRVASGEGAQTLIGFVQQIAAKLIGAPLSSFDPITQAIGRDAWQAVTENSLEKAWLIANLGLAILPEEPSLLALLADIEEQRGNKAEALASAQLALTRETFISPFWADRAKALSARLG